MSITYTPTTNFAGKDSLPSNDSNKVVKGAEFTTEFSAIQSAFALAAPSSNPTYTGTATFDDVSVTGSFTSPGIDDNATSTAITIDANENVGINTVTTLAPLTVQGPPNGTAASFGDGSEGSNRQLQFASSNNGQWWDINSTGTSGGLGGELTFSSKGSEAMRIKATGNVGVGTDAPFAKLETKGDGTTSATLSFAARDANDTARFYVRDDGDSVFAGNVGIGTSNPSEILTIQDASARVFTTNGTQELRSGVWAGAARISSTDALLLDSNTAEITLSTSGTERMRIDATGRVGIGADDPELPLDIKADSGANALNLRMRDADDYVFLRFNGATGGTGLANIGVQKQGTLTADMMFYTANGASSQERMRIDAAGNVKIATDAENTTTSKFLRFGSTFNRAEIEVENVSTYAADMHFATGNNANFSRRMTLTSTGSVGIGTDAPTEKLDVSGTASANGMKLGQNGTDLDSTFLGASSLIAFKCNGTEHMRIESSGKVGVGTDAPQELLHIESSSPTLRISNSTDGGWNTGDVIGEFEFWSTDGGGRSAGYIKSLQETSGGSVTDGALTFGTTTYGATAAVERMRLDTSGNLRVGRTSIGNARLSVSGTGTTNSTHSFEASNSLGYTRLIVGDAGKTSFYNADNSVGMVYDGVGNLLVGNALAGSVNQTGSQLLGTGVGIFVSDSDTPLYVNRRAGSSGYSALINIFRENVQSGYIGAAQGTTPTFAAPSDERLKDNIVDHESELANVMALRPTRWDWKDEARGTGEGFIAQELEQTAWSDLVSEGDDGFKIVAGLGTVETRLIKALQEAVGRIESLEAEVEALKNA